MSDKVTVGNVEIIAVIDLVPPARDPGTFFRGVSAKAFLAYAATIPEIQNNRLQTNRLHFSPNCRGN